MVPWEVNSLNSFIRTEARMGKYLDLIKDIGDIQQEPIEATEERLSDNQLRGLLINNAREISSLWRSVALELAEVVRYPKLELMPSRAGYIGGGEYLWRHYLHKAPALELKHRVIPELRRMIEEVGRP